MKSKTNIKIKKGFSLIELLVVIALIAIMTGVVFVQGRNKPQSDAENAALRVAAQLRSLQNDALNGKEVSSKSACKFELNVSPVTGSDSFNVQYYDCSGTPIAPSSTIKLKNAKIYGQDSGDHVLRVSFSSPQGRCDVSNLYPGGKINIASGNTYATICINSDTGKIGVKKGNLVNCD